MDWAGYLAVAVGTGVIGVPVAAYLVKLLLQHQLGKDLKDYEANLSRQLATHKADLDAQVNAAKSAHEATLKREVEEHLGERAAERAYVVEAKKRLYLAVGALRFQLLLACSEFASRVHGICTGDAYDMSMDRYFGRTTAYRLLRILALCELIERQVAFADFAVDPAMRSLLQFRRKAVNILSSADVTLQHPQQDWARQDEHFFKDVLGSLGGSLIVQEVGSAGRVMRFEEFVTCLTDGVYMLRIDPLPRLIRNFTPKGKPLLWLRLAALGGLCNSLIESQGTALGLDVKPIDFQTAIELAEDSYATQNLGAYVQALETAGRLTNADERMKRGS